MPNHQAVNNTQRLPNLTNLKTVKELLDLFQVEPRKSRGQNFITNAKVLDKIVRAAHLNRNELALEIGPGLGALTAALVQKAGEVLAIELDQKLYAILQQTFERWPFDNLKFINEDVLKIDLGELVKKTLARNKDLKKYKVVANLPYSITGKIIRKILETKPRATSFVLLVQKEVAQRMVAQPPQMNKLGIAVQTYGQVEIIDTVKSGSFWPKPKVDSAIIRIKSYPKPLFDPLDPVKYFQVIQAGFSQKRKKLVNALAGGLREEKEHLEAILEKIGLDPSKRAQHLKLEDWKKIAKSIKC